MTRTTKSVLTRRALAALSPSPAADRLVSDGSIAGLYVRVYKTGGKVWMFVTDAGGRQRWHTIGDVGGTLTPEDAALYGLPVNAKLDLDNARHAASVCRAQVRAGQHPGDLRRDAIESRRADALEARTVRDVSVIWMQEAIAASHKRPEIVQETLDRHVLPDLGGMRIDRVKRAHVAEVVAKLVKDGKRVTANRVLLTIKQMFRFAHERGYIEADPVAAFTRKSAGGKETARDRNLSFDEVAALARVLWSPQFFAEPVTRHLLQFVLLTGQRVGEIASAEWSHVDFDAREWHIPAANTKTGRAHVVHLSEQAVEVLREVQKHNKLMKYVFQSPRSTDPKNPRPVDPHSLARIVSRLFDDPDAPVDPRKRNKAKPKADRLHRRIKRPEERLTLHGKMQPFTPHDLRRTMASRMADLGHAPHVIEKCLNHALEGVLAVYQRAEWMPERKAAFESWGAKVEQLRTADLGNVVQLTKKRRRA